MKLTNPLRIKTSLKTSLARPDAVALIDVLLIAFILSLFSSQFFFTPGLIVDLPETTTVPLSGSRNISVVSINQANMIFFEGNIYTLETLEKTFAQHVESAQQTHPILLAKVSKHANIDTFFRVCEIAKRAGFIHVQLAANAIQS